MNHHYNTLIILILFIVIMGCETQEESNLLIDEKDNNMEINTDRIHFFENLKEYCGYSFKGQTIYPVDRDHLLTDASLEIRFEECSDSELRIPFYINGESTRDWIISLSEDSHLRLKHEHTPNDDMVDEINLYGGFADDSGSEYMQIFPADTETIRMLPKAQTNVWSIEIDTLSNELRYNIERNEEPRFEAVFDLSNPKLYE